MKAYRRQFPFGKSKEEIPLSALFPATTPCGGNEKKSAFLQTVL